MKKLIKKLYEFKIQWMFHFGLIYNEIATPIAVIRDVEIILLGLKYLLGINFGGKVDIVICILVFVIGTIGGYAFKETGLPAYATKLGNSISPELMLVRRIASKLGIKE